MRHGTDEQQAYRELRELINREITKSFVAGEFARSSHVPGACCQWGFELHVTHNKLPKFG